MPSTIRSAPPSRAARSSSPTPRVVGGQRGRPGAAARAPRRWPARRPPSPPSRASVASTGRPSGPLTRTAAAGSRRAARRRRCPRRRRRSAAAPPRRRAARGRGPPRSPSPTRSAARLPLKESGATTMRTAGSMPGGVVASAAVTSEQPRLLRHRGAARARGDRDPRPGARLLREGGHAADQRLLGAGGVPLRLVPEARRARHLRRHRAGLRLPGHERRGRRPGRRRVGRADGSVGTFYGVHSFLAMQSIAMLGVGGAAASAGCRRWPGWRRSARSG